MHDGKPGSFPAIHCGINGLSRRSLGYMNRSVLSGFLLTCAALALIAPGCLAPSVTGPGAHTAPSPVYARGDVLAGNMTAAGYDTFDPDIAGVRALVLGFEPGSDMYVYTFVRTLPNGSYGYVFSESWEAKLARPRPVFEAYGLGKVGMMAEEYLWKV